MYRHTTAVRRGLPLRFGSRDLNLGGACFKDEPWDIQGLAVMELRLPALFLRARSLAVAAWLVPAQDSPPHRFFTSGALIALILPWFDNWSRDPCCIRRSVS